MDKSGDTSFDSFLQQAPSHVSELTKHVAIGEKWYSLGNILGIEQKQLDEIEALDGDTNFKTKKMFQSWLATSRSASRNAVVDALTETAVNETGLAEKYKEDLRDIHDSTYNLTQGPRLTPREEACSIFQSHRQVLSDAICTLTPLSQFLYSMRCINESTLDIMESTDGSLDDKKHTLLSALENTVLTDGYKKLRDITTVLSNMEETKEIGNQMNEQIPDENEANLLSPNDPNEKQAVDILRDNYGALSQSLSNPVSVADILNAEGVISKEDAVSVDSGRSLGRKTTLLKAIRYAVRSNYRCLLMLVTILRQYKETADVGDAILEEFKNGFPEGETLEEGQFFLTERMEQSHDHSTSEVSQEEITASRTGHTILMPYNLNKEFRQLRTKFGVMFFKVRRIFSQTKVDAKEMKDMIKDFFPDLKAQICNKNVDGMLNVVKEKCTIIDVHYLKVIAITLEISEAVAILDSYNETVDSFCRSVSIRLCLEQKLQPVTVPPHFKSDTVTFILNWDNTDEYTLHDVKEVLGELEPLQTKSFCLQITNIAQSTSIAVTCYCHRRFTDRVATSVKKSCIKFQKKGLKRFMTGSGFEWTTNESSAHVGEPIGREVLPHSYEDFFGKKSIIHNKNQKKDTESINIVSPNDSEQDYVKNVTNKDPIDKKTLSKITKVHMDEIYESHVNEDTAICTAQQGPTLSEEMSSNTNTVAIIVRQTTADKTIKNLEDDIIQDKHIKKIDKKEQDYKRPI